MTIAPEHQHIQKAFQGMKRPPGLSEHLFEKEGDELSFEKLLPKNMFYNDFDRSENLIEIEDTSKGDRYWVPTQDIFRIPCPANFSLEFTIDKVVDVWTMEQFGELSYFDRSQDTGYQVHYLYSAKIIEFRPRIFRKRCYIAAILTILPDTKRPIYRTLLNSELNAQAI